MPASAMPTPASRLRLPPPISRRRAHERGDPIASAAARVRNRSGRMVRPGARLAARARDSAGTEIAVLTCLRPRRSGWHHRRREAVLIRRRVLPVLSNARVWDRDERACVAFRLGLKLETHVRVGGRELVRRVARREPDDEDLAVRELMRLVAAVPADGKQRRIRERGRIRESVHTAGKRIDTRALLRLRDETDLM